ncbi:hypothetical protein PybrP1_012150 [[Pythium] brassicae (nom. inval.)]|nr:hypothetical protein PybrP1_012150 [[Pythium] brassicae (nom. inval.)]
MRIQERDNAARVLAQAKASSSEWHQKEREEEVLILRRLERDVMDPQKTTPVAAGYEFFQVRGAAATRVSPVFFFAGFAKIALENVILEDDDDDGNGDSTSESELDGDGSKGSGIAVLSPLEREKLAMLMDARFQSASAGASSPCLVCNSASAMGCPGCFTFSHDKHHEVIASQSTRRLKTPMTKQQEQEERQERHKALQRQLVMPSIYRKDPRDDLALENGTSTRREDDFYANVLVDHYAIRKHRAIIDNFVTLHIKTLPVGSILSLQVDIRSSAAYVYELYRANTELPNRPIHLLLPTSNGLFYLNERIEDATDVRNGLIHGEFDLEDFHLHPSGPPNGALSPSQPKTAANNASTAPPASREFMLFSVAVLSDSSTPQLVTNYLQHNFRVLPHEFAGGDRLPIQRALSALPCAVDQDLCQRQLLPHVRRMQAFGRESKELALAEQHAEREALLRAAFQERKRARVEQRRRQNQRGGLNGRPSAKMRRAAAYFAYVCEATSNPTRARVFEERLEKLWQCFQLLEEWKICKAGRLVDAETTDATLALLKAHQEATTAAFDRVLERQGPLVLPILCVETGSSKLVIKLGVRLGASAHDDREYGLALDLEQDFDALGSSAGKGGGDRRRMQTRGLTKKALAQRAQEEEREVAEAIALCVDCEWRRGKKEPAVLLTSADLLRPPFYRFNWSRVAQAYKQAMRAVAMQSATLDAFNALARVLQSSDAILSKAQVATWQRDADKLLATLEARAASRQQQQQQQQQQEKQEHGDPKATAPDVLLQAARRVLVKKGAALLTKRARQRKQQLREREAELLRLQRLQAESELPRLSLLQQMKLAFARDKAPAIRAALELTPAEKLQQRAARLLDKVATNTGSAAAAAKKEYKVRAL